MEPEGLKVYNDFLDYDEFILSEKFSKRPNDYYPIPTNMSFLVKSFDAIQENHNNHISIKSGEVSPAKKEAREWGDDVNILAITKCLLRLHGQGPALEDDYRVLEYSLDPNTLVTLSGNVRYKWKYELIKSDEFTTPQYIMIRKRLLPGLPIKGLTIIENFITPEEESAMINRAKEDDSPKSYQSAAHISMNPADNEKRMFHAVYYDDSEKDKDKREDEIGPLPPPMRKIADRLGEHFGTTFNHLILNIYPATGVVPHIDSMYTGNYIGAIMLITSSTYVMIGPFGEKIPYMIPRRALVMMTGESRFQWKHGVPPPMGPVRSSAIFRRKIGHWWGPHSSNNAFEEYTI